MAFLAQGRPMLSRRDAFLVDMADFEIFEEEPPQRIPGPEILERFQRLLALIQEQPARLDAGRVLDLLPDAGFADEFEDLFRHADHIGLNARVIAVIILALLLRGPLGEYVSKEMQSSVISLQEHAEQATKTIREMGRHGIALIRVV